MTDVYELRVHGPIWTVNAEVRGSMHWRKRGELVSAMRWAAKVEAMQAKVPKQLHRVEITATPMQDRRGPAADPGAYASPVKAAIDGLRDAGILVEDTDRYVAQVRHMPSVRVDARDVGLIIQLRPVQATDARPL